MPTTIKIKNGSGAPTSSDLVQGELAIDLTNKRLYTEDGSANILELGTSPSTIDINAGTIDGVTLGTNSAVTEAQIDNININGNAITSTDTNGNIAITPNGTGEVDISKVDINGGTIDGVTIGGASAGAGTFTTLTTGSTVTLNGGTANGVLYLNGSKVATSGSALTFDGTNFVNTAGYLGTTQSGATSSYFIAKNSVATSGVVFGAHSSGAGYIDVINNNPLFFAVNDTEQMRLTSTGLGIGTTSPGVKLSVDSGATQEYANFNSTAASGGYLTLTRSGANGIIIGNYAAASGGGSTINADALFFRTPNGIGFGSGGASVTAFMDASGNLGLGVTPSAWGSTFKALQIGGNGVSLWTQGSTAGALYLSNNTYYDGASRRYIATASASEYQQAGGSHLWFTAPSGTAGNAISFTQAMTLDASGNLLVGNTIVNPASGFSNQKGFGYAASTGKVEIATTANDAVIEIGKNNANDGILLVFRKQGTVVGSIGALSGNLSITSPESPFIAGEGSQSVGLRMNSSSSTPAIIPVNNVDSIQDNAIDLGFVSGRFDDVYATNALIQTSDRNEKQDIEALSEAEQRVAVAAKALMRKFRWKDAVEEKGDDARIHFGIIAQDLQAAFEAEGLDAGRYAMFIHSTWTDEETGEERSRMGVRYSELLAFIISAI